MENIEEQKPGFHEKAKAIFWIICKVALAIGIITWILTKTPIDFNKVSNLQVSWILLAMLFYLTHLLVGAYRWYLLLKVLDIKVSFFESLSLMMQGCFFSLVIPGGAIGGDLVKAKFLISRTPPGKKLEGTFTILMDRIIGMIALFSLAGVIGLLSISIILKLDGIMEVMIYALILGCFGGLAAVCVIFFHREIEKIKPLRKLMQLADKYSGNKITRISESLDIYRSSYPTLISCIAMSIIFVHLNVGMVVYLISKSVGIVSPQIKVVILAVTAGNTAGLIPLTQAGVGTRDKVITDLLMAGGINGSDAALIALIFTAFILFFNLLGGLFFIFGRNKDKITGEDILEEANKVG
jgi:glycosyltransferase 2 family protein